MLVAAWWGTGFATAQETANCLPDGFSVRARQVAPQPPAAAQLNLLIDGTESMAGYYTPSRTTSRAFNAARIIAVLDDVAESVDGEPHYYRVGSKVIALEAARGPALESVLESPNFYLTGQDRFKTGLDEAFKFAAHQPRGSLTAILTDLFITEDPHHIGQTRMELQLRNAIRAGHSVGIWGIVAGFNGRAFDIPGQRLRIPVRRHARFSFF